MKRTLTSLIMVVSKRTGEILVIWVCIGILMFSSAQAQGPIIIGMGDSIGEGVQSADASLRTQRFSYLTFLAQQMGIRFPLPFIRSSPIGIVGDTIFRCRLWPDVSALNLSVAGADALDEDEIDSETDLVLFPRLGSQMEIAESTGASFVVCWIGNNDVLSAAISFDQLDASQMTPVEDFRAAFMEKLRNSTIWEE